MARTLITWTSSTGDSITFTTGIDAVHRLMTVDGLENVPISPLHIKSPNQPGQTAVDVVVPGRTVTITGLLQVENFSGTPGQDRVWDARRAMTKALVQQPTRLGEDYALGYLTVTRPDQQALEIDAIPVSVSLERMRGPDELIPFDLEFFCPSPYWRETADTVEAFTAAGGFEWTLEFALEMTSNNVEIEIINNGTVDTPILFTVTGDVTTARIINVTYDETLEIEGNLPDTKQWEVSTEFGNKYIDEITISGGARVGVLDKIDLTKADFWVLRPGLNLVKFEADVNTSGSAIIAYREQYGGM